jgi:alginate O-acetyltransferase complex protein AlgI
MRQPRFASENRADDFFCQSRFIPPTPIRLISDSVLFNSLPFLIFFPCVTAAYFVLPHRLRWLLLLLASCFFYAFFKPVYILILAGTIVVDYFAAILIAGAPTGRKRRLWLLASIAANVGVLVFFKYFNFLNQTLRELANAIHAPYNVPFLDILLPIGLSFHIFQSLSYTIEVYRGEQEPERHFGIYALYVMFYPQLVAGPIERPQNMLHQFHAIHRFQSGRAVSGLQLMLWGFFKKVVVADRLAAFVSTVYDHPEGFPGISILLATFCFAFQIYCDFSGYSDVAIGSARVMGFDLMKNFDRPYFSKSISEFWKRWHISLSTWFKDYVYIPLGGNRVARSRWYLNLLITFALSGLWHGASWTYVVWGTLNGLYLISELAIAKRYPAFLKEPDGSQLKRYTWRASKVALTFALTCVAWMFFRSSTTDRALYMLAHMGDGLTSLTHDLQNYAFVKANILFLQERDDFVIAFSGLALLLAVEWLERRRSPARILLQAPGWLKWSLRYAAIATILLFGGFNHAQQFIYFQF